MKNFEEQKSYERAQKHVTELKAFYGNLTSYVLVISFLAGLNYYTDQWNNPWFLWPAFGWGIGIVAHALKTYRVNPLFNKDWEQRKIRKYMDEEEKNKTQLWE